MNRPLQLHPKLHGVDHTARPTWKLRETVHFYRDILGFHLYWEGGMNAGKNDWVAMQVPDGTDWAEYMLNIEPNADQHTMGVMNHISLGVKDIKQAQAKLESRGWKQHSHPAR